VNPSNIGQSRDGEKSFKNESGDSDISPGLDSLLGLIGLPKLNTNKTKREDSTLGFSDTIATFFSPSTTEKPTTGDEKEVVPSSNNISELPPPEEKRRASGVASLEADVKEIADNIGGLFSSFGMSATDAVAGFFGNEAETKPVEVPKSTPSETPALARKDSKKLQKSNSMGSSGPSTRGRTLLGGPRRNTALAPSTSALPAARPQVQRSSSYRSASPRSRFRQSTGSIGSSSGAGGGGAGGVSGNNSISNNSGIRPSKRPVAPPSAPSPMSPLRRAASQRASVGSEPKRRSSGFGALFNNAAFSMKKSPPPPAIRRATSFPTSANKSPSPSSSKHKSGLTDRSKDVAELGGLLAKRGTLTPAETKRVQELMRRNSQAKHSLSIKASVAAVDNSDSDHDNDSASGSDVEVDGGDVADISMLEKLAGH
jgi:hypothetical protein